LLGKNGWRACNGPSSTTVAAGWHPTGHVGALFIDREGTAPGHGGLIYVPHTHYVMIVSAPTGDAAATSAQRHGVLRFVSDNGIKGALHLSNETAVVGGQVLRVGDH
jgi:hypothetical protein